jgi:serine protease Do
MKRFLTTLTGIAALVLLTQAVEAQDKDKDKEKSKTKSEEIIIRRKTDKDAKVTVEIKGDEVLVNGKPADEYEDENISITKRRSSVVISPRTPFRSGTWSYSGDGWNNAEANIAFLGVTTEEHEKGARIESVSDESAAEKAGLKKGDIITKVGDKTIDKPEDLTKAVRSHKPEEKVSITYLRDGKEQKSTVTLGKRSSVLFGNLAPSIEIPNFNYNFDNGAFGRAYTFPGRARLGVKAQDTEDGKGVKVLEIDDESIAEKAGLKKDDIITEFDGKTINDTDALAKAARESREKASVTVKYPRAPPRPRDARLRLQLFAHRHRGSRRTRQRSRQQRPSGRDDSVDRVGSGGQVRRPRSQRRPDDGHGRDGAVAARRAEAARLGRRTGHAGLYNGLDTTRGEPPRRLECFDRDTASVSVRPPLDAPP